MIVYGKNVVRELVYNNHEIYKLYLDHKFNDRSFLNFLEKHNIVYEEVAKDKLNELTNNALHQGVVADIKPYFYLELEDVIDSTKKQNFLVLDEISDPQNLGAILRTAEATQIDAVIVSNKNQVPLNATVAKVSSGAIEHVKVVKVTNFNKMIDVLKKANFLIYGTADDASLLYNQLPQNGSIAVILGNEGKGIRPFVKLRCDALVKIPMYGKINSLNVSVAGALMMYEMIKR